MYPSVGGGRYRTVTPVGFLVQIDVAIHCSPVLLGFNPQQFIKKKKKKCFTDIESVFAQCDSQGFSFGGGWVVYLFCCLVLSPGCPGTPYVKQATLKLTENLLSLTRQCWIKGVHLHAQLFPFLADDSKSWRHLTFRTSEWMSTVCLAFLLDLSASEQLEAGNMALR